MQAGLLNEKIELYRFIKVKNEYGELVTQTEKVRDCRAKVSHLSGSRTVRAEEIQYPYTKQFVVRIHIDIDENMWIKWRGKFYRVLSIDPNRELQQKTIIAEIVNE